MSDLFNLSTIIREKIQKVANTYYLSEKYKKITNLQRRSIRKGMI